MQRHQHVDASASRSTIPPDTARHRSRPQVPEDANFMDMVFSDTGDLHGGFYDNNGGLDYHVPVAGGRGEPPRLRIAHVSVEMAPIAKASWRDCCLSLGFPRTLSKRQHRCGLRRPEMAAPHTLHMSLSKRGHHREKVFSRFFIRAEETLETMHTNLHCQPATTPFYIGCAETQGSEGQGRQQRCLPQLGRRHT